MNEAAGGSDNLPHQTSAGRCGAADADGVARPKANPLLPSRTAQALLARVIEPDGIPGEEELESRTLEVMHVLHTTRLQRR